MDVPFPEYGILADGRDTRFMKQITEDEGGEKVYAGWLKVALSPEPSSSTTLTLTEIYTHLTSTLSPPPGTTPLSSPTDLLKHIQADPKLALHLKQVKTEESVDENETPDTVEDTVDSQPTVDVSTPEADLADGEIVLPLPPNPNPNPNSNPNPHTPLTPPATARLPKHPALPALPTPPTHPELDTWILTGHSLREPTYEEVSEIWRGVGMSLFRWGLRRIGEMREGRGQKLMEVGMGLDGGVAVAPAGSVTVDEKDGLAMEKSEEAVLRSEAPAKGSARDGVSDRNGQANVAAIQADRGVLSTSPMPAITAPTPSTPTAHPSQSSITTRPPISTQTQIFDLPDSAFTLHDKAKLPYPEFAVRRLFPLPGVVPLVPSTSPVRQNAVAGPSMPGGVRLLISSPGSGGVGLGFGTRVGGGIGSGVGVSDHGGAVGSVGEGTVEEADLPKRGLYARQVVGVEGARLMANAWLRHMLTPEDKSKPRFTYLSSVYDVYKSYAYHPPGCPLLEYDDFVDLVRGKENIVMRKDGTLWPGDEIEKGYYDVTAEVGDWRPSSVAPTSQPKDTFPADPSSSSSWLLIRASLQLGHKTPVKVHEAIWFSVGMGWRKAKTFNWDPNKVASAAAAKVAGQEAKAAKRREEKAVLAEARRVEREVARKVKLEEEQARRGSGMLVGMGGSGPGAVRVQGMINGVTPANGPRPERALPYTPEATDNGEGHSDSRRPASGDSQRSRFGQPNGMQAGPPPKEWAREFAGDFVRMWLRDAYAAAPRGQSIQQKELWQAFSGIVRRELDHYDRQMAIFREMRHDPRAEPSYDRFLDQQGRFRLQLERHHAIICNYLGAQPGDLFKMVVTIFGAQLGKSPAGDFVIDGLVQRAVYAPQGRDAHPTNSKRTTEARPLSDSNTVKHPPSQYRPIAPAQPTQPVNGHLHDRGGPPPIPQPGPFHLPQPHRALNSFPHAGHAPIHPRPACHP